MSWYDFCGISLPDLSLVDIRSAIQVASQWQPTAIRLPIYPGEVEHHVPAWPFNQEYIDSLLIPAITYATAQGLQVIVDHHEVGSVVEKEWQTKDFWERLLPALKPFDVILEVFNEPTDAEWKRYRPSMQRIVSFIRERTNKPLLVGTPRYCKVLAPAVEHPIIGSDLAYTAHVYPERIPLAMREEFDIEESYSVFESIDMCREKYPVVLSEVGWDSEFGTDEFMIRVEKLMRKTSWIAWVLYDKWWPSLVDGGGQLTDFGRDIQRIRTWV